MEVMGHLTVPSLGPERMGTCLKVTQQAWLTGEACGTLPLGHHPLPAYVARLVPKGYSALT